MVMCSRFGVRSIAMTVGCFMLMGTPFALASSMPPAQSPVLKPKPIAPPKPTPTTSPTPTKLQPFFDRTITLESVSFPRTQGVDVTPEPPAITAFDRAVLSTCGAFGSRVSADQVRRLFAQNPAVVAAIQTAVNGNVQPRRGFNPEQSSPTFQEDLVEIWTGLNGFEHIFCGQIKGDSVMEASQIGGLHFAPRYYELQQKGIAGRLGKNQPAEEVIPGVVYTIGVEVKQNGRRFIDRKKGYSTLQNAQEILVDGTKAYKAFKIKSGANQAVCLYRVLENSGDDVLSLVLVKNDRGIITFYPDATPEPGSRSCGETDANSGVNLENPLNSDNSSEP